MQKLTHLGFGYLVAMVTALICGLFLPATTIAQEVLVVDQSFVVSLLGGSGAPFIRTDQSFAQTFTVANFGILARVGVQIDKAPGTTGNDVILEIRTTSNGIPNPDNSQSLFTGIIPLEIIPDRSPFTAAPLTSVDVLEAGIIVLPGDILAISLRREADQFPFGVFWQAGAIEKYADGEPFWRRNQTEAWGSPPNNDDLGFQTSLALPVTIDGCDTGVLDQVFDGSTISKRIEECSDDAHNHGEFVRCVAYLTNDLKKSGVISGNEKGAIQKCAGQADIP